MNTQSYFPNYYAVEDIFVTQEKVECKVNTKLLKMGKYLWAINVNISSTIKQSVAKFIDILGFLDAGADTEDLNPGRTINLPLWYIKELKINNPYFSICVPDIYKNVHKAVCEAETTHIELGKLHPFFYEYGRYLTPYDRNHVVGKIVFETMRQRVRHLLDISKNSTDCSKPELRLDDIENKLFDAGSKTNILFTNWLQMKSNNIDVSEMVQEHTKKRKRERISDADSPEQDQKRPSF